MKRIALAAVLVIVAALAWASLPSRPLPRGTRVDRIVVEKAARRLTVYVRGVPVKAYRVSLGRSPVGKKQRVGDNRTPEGIYRIDGRNAASKFHRALHVSYPNASDRANAATAGVSPGGEIMVHGLPNGLAWVGHLQSLGDWTRGCIALSNADIDELWDSVPIGTPIEIRP